MSFFPINEVRGKHLVQEEKLKFKVEKIKSISDINFDGPVDLIELKKRDDRLLYIFRFNENQVAFDAITGKIISFLNEQEVIQTTSKKLLFPSIPNNIALINSKSREYNGDLPVWRIDYIYPEVYSLYISPITGEIKTIRNQKWRIFDFFWMLHIMDYTARENINSPWLLGLAIASVIFAITGFLLIWSTFRRKRFK